MMKCQVEMFLIVIAIYSAPSTTDAPITTLLALATLIEFVNVGADLRQILLHSIVLFVIW